MKSNESQDYGFKAAREMDELLRDGICPDQTRVILPNNTDHTAYKGFAAFYGVGSIEPIGALDDLLRQRYREVEIGVIAVNEASELPDKVKMPDPSVLPGFVYTFTLKSRRNY